MTEWLRHNCEPLSTVKDYMKKTFAARAKRVREDRKGVAETLDYYPRLLTPGMVGLVEWQLLILLKCIMIVMRGRSWLKYESHLLSVNR